jgi:hypothetical protein
LLGRSANNSEASKITFSFVIYKLVLTFSIIILRDLQTTAIQPFLYKQAPLLAKLIVAVMWGHRISNNLELP